MSMGIEIERPYIHHLDIEQVKCRDMIVQDMQMKKMHMRNPGIVHQ
jgi:hypothetical protein